MLAVLCENDGAPPPSYLHVTGRFSGVAMSIHEVFVRVEGRHAHAQKLIAQRNAPPVPVSPPPPLPPPVAPHVDSPLPQTVLSRSARRKARALTYARVRQTIASMNDPARGMQ